MNRTRSTLLGVVLILTGAFSVSAQECKRHVESQGGFSICIPEGWRVEERAGEKYKFLFAPAGQSLTPNLNFKDEDDSRSLDEYVALSVKNILANYQKVLPEATSVTILSQDNFMTTGGISAIRIVIRTEYKGLVVRTLQYYFSRADRKFVLTGTELEQDQTVLDSIFDAAAKSFRFEK